MLKLVKKIVVWAFLVFAALLAGILSTPESVDSQRIGTGSWGPPRILV
jgi:hypothetical protein